MAPKPKSTPDPERRPGGKSLRDQQQRLVLDLDLLGIDRPLEDAVRRCGRIVLADEGDGHLAQQAFRDEARLVGDHPCADDPELGLRAGENAHERVARRHRARARIAEMDGHAGLDVRPDRIVERHDLARRVARLRREHLAQATAVQSAALGTTGHPVLLRACGRRCAQPCATEPRALPASGPSQRPAPGCRHASRPDSRCPTEPCPCRGC